MRASKGGNAVRLRTAVMIVSSLAAMAAAQEPPKHGTAIDVIDVTPIDGIGLDRPNTSNVAWSVPSRYARRRRAVVRISLTCPREWMARLLAERRDAALRKREVVGRRSAAHG